jgi:hypothetical protein
VRGTRAGRPLPLAAGAIVVVAPPATAIKILATPASTRATRCAAATVSPFVTLALATRAATHARVIVEPALQRSILLAVAALAHARISPSRIPGAVPAVPTVGPFARTA